MNVELIKEFYFEAAHRNPRSQGSGARLHGHSFRVEIVAEGETDPTFGWLIDYGDIKGAFQPLLDQLDHAYLNEIPGLEDASIFNVAAWIAEHMRPALPCLKHVRVSVAGDNAFRPVELEPDPETGLPCRWRFTFEAAQSLPYLPEGHPCRRLHGHTYRIEVGAHDMDLLRSHLRSIYDVLDHRYLNELPELGEATSECLCAWIWSRLTERMDGLLVVVVQETATARCIYHGE